MHRPCLVVPEVLELEPEFVQPSAKPLEGCYFNDNVDVVVDPRLMSEKRVDTPSTHQPKPHPVRFHVEVERQHLVWPHRDEPTSSLTV